MAKRKSTQRKPRAKKEETQKAVRFTSGGREGSPNDMVNLDTMTATMKQAMAVEKQRRDILSKSVSPITVRKDVQKKYDRSKIVFSSREYSGDYEGIETKSWRRLSDRELRELSQVDPYVSAIIATRSSQGAICGRPSDSKFDKGSRVHEIDPLRLDDFNGRKDFEKNQKLRGEQSKTIMEWMQRCGTNSADIMDAAFEGADNTFKQCNLPDFISAQMRNLLTFGRCGTQIFRNQEGLPVMFRPVPIETIYNVVEQEDVHIGISDETMDQSAEDEREYNELPEGMRPAAYIQRVNGRNVNFFTEDDLKVWHYQKQALFDLNGYPLAPIEQAIYMVYTHQQTLGYLRNQFIKGLGTKGILTLESTDPSAQLSDDDLETLRREFHNFLSRNDNSAATPVISGPVKVGYVPLVASPRDMEFLQVEEHVVRALCSAMQISPQEMGYGHLSIGQGGLNQANKQEEIIRGEERGLRMVLDIIFDGLNEILYENFPEAAEKYRLTYVGVGEDTRDAVVNRHNQELNTTATMSSLWADSEKSDPIPFGGDVPLASAFHANVARYMKYGEFMEHFFGIEGAARSPEYDFIIDPTLNESYQRLKSMPMEMQQAESEIQVQTEATQLEGMQEQNQMQQMQMQMGMQQEGAPEEGQPPEEGAPEEEQPVENAAKSLREEYLEREQLHKSMKFYFKEWMNAHEEEKN